MEFKINKEFIKLDQLLKATNIASSGAEAKVIILDGKVTVNGEIERRRGRKLYKDYTVGFSDDDTKILIR